MGLFKKSRDEVLKEMYHNSKGIRNFIGNSIYILIDDKEECLKFQDAVKKNILDFRIKFSDLYSISRYTETNLASSLTTWVDKNAKSELIFLTKIEYVENNEIKNILLEEAWIGKKKRIEFTENVIKRIPKEQPKLEKTARNNDDVIQQVKGLKELLDIGAITEEEFNKKKKELLNL
ncbi:SHOCT domain-containing protein [Clostridioides difficile]|nr:SHOCT domain-containing protein [Clostridioides difficile]